LIYVREEFRVAIENYLEPYLNYYVVHTLEDAAKAIRLLSQSQKGKANFFILDAFHNYEPPMALLPGAYSAMDLIEAEPAYRKLCSYLLENVLIVESDDIAKVDQEGDYTLLSKGGHFIKKLYSISGGSIGLFEGKKIGRKKNLELLEKAIKKLEAEEEKLANAFYNLKTKAEQLKAERDDRKIHTERESLNRIVQEKISLTSRQENLQSMLGESSDRHGKLSQEAQSL